MAMPCMGWAAASCGTSPMPSVKAIAAAIGCLRESERMVAVIGYGLALERGRAASDSLLTHDSNILRPVHRPSAAVRPRSGGNAPAFGWKSPRGQANDACHRDTVLPHLTAIQPNGPAQGPRACAQRHEIRNGETLMPNRTTEFLKHARPALAAAAFLLGASVAAMAQSAPAGGDVSQWLKICDPKHPDTCMVTKDYVVESGPNALATFSLQATPDKTKFGLGVTVPTGFIFPPGIPVSVDGTKKATAHYVVCLPAAPKSQRVVCIAQAQVAADFVTALKKGGTLEIQLTTGDAKTVPIDFSLSGFSKAFDGPDMGEAALLKQREETAKIFQEKAQQRGQQLIEEQRKAAKASGG